MVCGISTHDFIKRVSEKLRDSSPVSAEPWVRFQFCPKNAYCNSWLPRDQAYGPVQAVGPFLSADAYAYHAAAVLCYVKDILIKFIDIATFLSQDDKNVMKVGETG